MMQNDHNTRIALLEGLDSVAAEIIRQQLTDYKTCSLSTHLTKSGKARIEHCLSRLSHEADVVMLYGTSNPAELEMLIHSSPEKTKIMLLEYDLQKADPCIRRR